MSVYFALCREANALKIGITQSLPFAIHKRVSLLQGGCPLRIELIGVLPGYNTEEREIHERFAHLLIHGEWFRFTPELQEFCETLEPVPEKPAPLNHGNTPKRKWGPMAEQAA